MSSSSAAPTTRRERRNWQIHLAYVGNEHKECLRLIERQLKECAGMCEYPIYVKALILRRQGRVQESLELFQAAICLNPCNTANLKQVGRSLFLLGKHAAAIDVYAEAGRLTEAAGNGGDWEIHHNVGLCRMYLKDYDGAAACLRAANAVSRHDATYLQLGAVHTLREDYRAAVATYLEALEFSPDSADLLTAVGLLYLRLGENFRAFDYLGNSLTHDPTSAKTILAAGSIIQNHNDMDVALHKYRVAAVQDPHCAQLWNNVGMCFFGKRRLVAAISCLKHALYLDPFEWIVAYNLGLVHLNTGQYASAFHYLSAAISAKPAFAHSYMYLAIALGRLDDFENACAAYEKAIALADAAAGSGAGAGAGASAAAAQAAAAPEGSHLFHLNFAITLYNNDEVERAAEQLSLFERLYQQLDDEARSADADVVAQREALTQAIADER
jgi:Bardet-Biedl syndrome 4 protein